MVRNLPLSWYVEKIERRGPFTSLLFGDGEFAVASGKALGNRMAYGELVTRQMEEEMSAALDHGDDPSILYGTDAHLIYPETYGGRDIEAVRDAAARAREAVAGKKPIDWVDGTCWDTEVREGRLGPLLKVLHKREISVIGNKLLKGLSFLHPIQFVEIPDTNAYGVIDRIEESILGNRHGVVPVSVVVVCAGLCTIPLIMRLRRVMRTTTFLDLGSVLDVFAALGSGRGWRRELYANADKLKKVIDANLEGVCDLECGEIK